MKKLILISLTIFFAVNSFCQENNTELNTYIENIIEEAAGDDNSTIDIESLIEDLEGYYHNPINLNIATEIELQKLWILNDFQIKSLLDHRKKVGRIVSYAELAYLFGFTHKTVNLIRPFIIIGEKQFVDTLRFKKVIEKSKYEFISRSSYSPSDKKQESTGMPASLYFRFLGNYRDKIRFGIIAENDVGERINFNSQNKGLDFYSAHFSFKLNKTIPSIILGDYRVKSGQGLLTWNGFSQGKSVEILAMQKRGQGIRPNTSKNESCYFRGVAITTNVKPLSIQLFASNKLLDASIDSLDNLNGVRTIYTNGYHRDSSELAKENILKEVVLGSRLGYNSARTALGINLLGVKYSMPILPPEKPYQYYNFTGDKYLGASIDYKFMLKKMQIFGETALNGQTYASINGINLLITDNFSTTVLQRNLPPQYYSPYSAVFSENSNMNNENGTFLGFNWNTNWKINLSAYTDIFSFPWYSYNANGPLKGTDYMAQLIFSPSYDFKLVIRYKRKIKEKNLLSEELTNKILHPFERESFRIHMQYKLSERLSMSNRFEWCQSGYTGIKYNPGYLVYHDVRYKPKDNFTLLFRYAWFDVKDYYSRIYAYEHDVLYAYSMPAYYGIGQKIYLVLRYALNRKYTVWLRYDYGNYFRDKAVTDQNIRAQVRIRF